MFRKLLAGATAVVATAALSIIGLASPADAVDTNPLAATHGFSLLTSGDATSTGGGNHTQGSWAVGGDYVAQANYALINPLSGQSLPALDGAADQLVVNGSIVDSGVSGEFLDLNAGALRVGNTSGWTVDPVTTNRYGEDAEPGTFARMITPNGAVTSSLYSTTFGGAFSTLQANANTIHAFSAGTSGVNVLSLIDGDGSSGYSNPAKGIRLVAGMANVLHISASDLSAISELVVLGAAPSATTTLYIDVTGGGDVTFPKVRPGNGVTADQTASIATYTLFDFAGASTLRIDGADSVYGSILAPGAAVTLASGKNYEGQIVAASFTHAGSGEFHGVLFGGGFPQPKNASGSWSFTKDCTAGNTITVDAAANVTYTWSATHAPSGAAGTTFTSYTGSALPDGEYAFTAQAVNGYTLTGPSTFDETLTAQADCAQPAASYVLGGCVDTDGSSTQPVTFVFDNSKSAVPVIFAVTGTTISVTVQPGATDQTQHATAPQTGASYEVTTQIGTRAATHLTTLTVPAFTGCTTVVVGDPRAAPGDCEAGVQQSGTITLDAKTGVVYEITGPNGYDQKDITAGSVSVAPGDYVVTASATTGHTLSYANPAKWPYQLTVGSAENCGVTPKTPTADQEVSCTSGSYTLPSDSNVIWDVVTTREGLSPVSTPNAAPTIYPVSTVAGKLTVDVTATPVTGVQFAPHTQTSWEFVFTQPAEGCTPTFADFHIEWSSTTAVCTSGTGAPTGTITVGPAEFLPYVAYVIDGQRVTSSNGVVTVSAGDHVLTASAVDADDTVDNPGPHTITVTSSTAICGVDLKTLALTGVSGWTVLLAGGVVLMVLGVALALIPLTRRRGRHGV